MARPKVEKEDSGEDDKVMKRFELKFDPQTLGALDDYQKAINAGSSAETIRRAISLAVSLVQLETEGARIVAEMPNGDKYIILTGIMPKIKR